MVNPFSLGGDVASIRASARSWSGFAWSADSASADLKGVQTSDFIGTEGDTYRSRIDSDLVPHLDVACEAWDLVAKALQTYASGLEELQSKMSALAAQYSDDESKEFLRDLYDQASVIRQEHSALLNKCCSDIKTAKDMRPVKPPGTWDKIGNKFKDAYNGVKKFVAEHSGILKIYSSVMKVVAAVAGVLALIPVLTPVCAPLALAAGAGALAADALVMWATDSWDVKTLALDALGVIPGGKAFQLANKLTRVKSMAAAVTRADDALNAANRARQAARAARIPNGLPGARASRQAIAAATNDVNRARSAARSTRAAQQAMDNYFAKVEKVWGRVELGTTVTSTGVTGVTTYQETGSVKDTLAATGISALGIAIPGMSDKAGAVQGLVTGAVSSVQQGAEFGKNPEKLKDPNAVVDYLTNVAGAAIPFGKAFG